MNHAVASYFERHAGLTREYVLHSDKITIHGRRLFREEFETIIPLTSMSPEISQVRFRGEDYIRGVRFFVIFMAVAGFLVGFFKLPPLSTRVIITVLLGIACLMWALVFTPKVHAYRFLNAHGMIVLDIIAAGPQREICHDFVEKVSHAIASARQTAER